MSQSIRRKDLLKIRSPTDLALGLLFVLVALIAFALQGGLPVGTSTRMGPGYLPRAYAWILLGLGLFLAGRALMSDGPPLPRWQLRPLVCLFGSILTFSLMLERFGIALTVFASVVIAGLGSSETRYRENVVFAASLAAACVVVFSLLLGLPFRVIPSFVAG